MSNGLFSAKTQAGGFSIKDDASQGEFGANCRRNCASLQFAENTVPTGVLQMVNHTVFTHRARRRLFQLRLAAGLRQCRANRVWKHIELCCHAR
jgi:hypothetical protein